MNSRLLTSCLILPFLVGVVVADEPQTAPAPKPKAPDFAGYAWVSKFTAEVVKADENKVTMRVYWEHAVATGNGNRNGRGGRPSLHNSGRNHHSPFHVRMPHLQLKWEHHDYEVPYVAESLVRTRTLPPKLGPDGKKGYYSAAEQKRLSLPIGAPYFEATKADLVPGTVIEAQIIRDKTIPLAKVTEKDMKLKYAVILRHDPNPPKDIASGSAEKKK
jgi:hypothetical protein